MGCIYVYMHCACTYVHTQLIMKSTETQVTIHQCQQLMLAKHRRAASLTPVNGK